MFAAWPGATYNNAEFCGACVRVTGPKGSVDVEVTNKCPECAEGSLDLSTAAFEKIADKSAGRGESLQQSSAVAR
jgi:expansin